MSLDHVLISGFLCAATSCYHHQRQSFMTSHVQPHEEGTNIEYGVHLPALYSVSLEEGYWHFTTLVRTKLDRIFLSTSYVALAVTPRSK